MHDFNMGGSKFFPKQQTNDMKSLFGRDKQNSELIFLESGLHVSSSS